MNNPNITHVPLNSQGASMLGLFPCGWCKDISLSKEVYCLTEKCKYYKKWVVIKQEEWDKTGQLT